MATKKEPEAVNETVNLSEIQAQIAQMLADARAEAAKIVEEAKKAVAPQGGMSAEELEKHKAEMEELVEIKLFKDTGKYKDDVLVGVNGEFIAIKRGERVKIKRKYAEVLDHSEHQDYETAQLIEKKSGEWHRKAEEANIFLC